MTTRPSLSLAAALLTLACHVPWVALAQAECLASFNVRPDRSVTYLSLGPTAGDRVTQTMRCVDAERLRGEMFLSGQALDPAILSDVMRFRAQLARLDTELAARLAALEAAQTDAAISAALSALEVTATGWVLAATAVACPVSGGTACPGAFAAAVRLVVLGRNIGQDASERARNAVTARSEINALRTAIATARSAWDDARAQQSRLRYNATFSAICNAIRQQCLD
jgi:hypothetical protein